MYEQLLPILMASDVRRSSLFYQNVLGFKMEVAVDTKQQVVSSLSEGSAELAFVILTYGEKIRLAIEHRDSFEQLLEVPPSSPPSATVSFYFHVEDVDQLFAQIRDHARLPGSYARDLVRTQRVLRQRPRWIYSGLLFTDQKD